MVLSAREFYGKYATEHASKHSIDSVPDALTGALNDFVDEVSHGPVLDAGAGGGRDTAAMTARGVTVVSVDIARPMLEIAQQNTTCECAQMDFRELAIKSDSVGGVWAPASIFFTPPEQMQTTLNEFHRVLHEDGFMRVGFKVGNGETTKHEFGDTVTQYLVSVETAKELVENAGFHIETVELMMPTPTKTFAHISAKPK